MMKRLNKKNEKGFAILESVVFMMAFVILAAYSIDLFSIVHTGIVDSTAARTYLFETLQHRSNINMLRQGNEFNPNNSGYDRTLDYTTMHFRFNVVHSEAQDSNDSVGAKIVGRTITQAESTGHNVSDPKLDSQSNKTNIVYLKNGYGICLDSVCPEN
jgi:hypothetical protein